MGCFFSKQNQPRYRCRQCHGDNVNSVFERLCHTCSSAARLAGPGDGSEKPCFGEYRCGACSRFWTSRLCWPQSYQACRRCRQHVYPFNWRELTPRDVGVNTTSQEHLREFCQKCQEVGYYCGTYARLSEKLQRY